MILSNRPWAAQPPRTIARVDWSHWAARGLVSWLPGNGHWEDAAREIHATMEGAPQFSRAQIDRLGKVVTQAWDGSDDGASVGVLPAFGDLTVVAWVNLDTAVLTSSYHGLISRGGVFENSTNFCFGFRWTGTELRPFLYARTSGGTLQGSEPTGSSISTGWTRVIATRTGSSTSFYGNGALYATGSGSTGSDGGQALRYGRPNTFTTTDARFPTAALDLRVYNRVWTAADVQADWAEGPWALFEARRNFLPVRVEPPAGGGFQAAWARNANTVITTGARP